MPISKSRLASAKTSARSSSSSSSSNSRQRELLFKQAELDERERLKKKQEQLGGDEPECEDESIEQLEEAYEAISQEAERIREQKMDDYQRMVSDTGCATKFPIYKIHCFYVYLCYRTIPLQKLAFSPAGVALFDELCLRVDINQVGRQKQVYKPHILQ